MKTLYYLWICIVSIFFSCISANDLPEGGKIWALLVAGSNGYFNYRHQADVCHAYQLLHTNGIPDENIIVMMQDDIAFNNDNPTQGIILNSPGGPNVYKGVPKDYTGNTVNPENFLNVLSGNKTGVRGIGSGRVIESGPKDHLFINFVDHGGPGILCFADEVLSADDLVATLSEMAAKQRFAKVVLYIEACHAGSLFDDLLPDDLNIFVVTAADPHESSYACYYDEERQTYLGDVFSVTWLNDSEHESLPMESLHHQYEKVRTLTNTSHVEEYGDLDIGVTKLSEVIGFRMSLNGEFDNYPPPIGENDVTSNIDAPLDIINRKLKSTKDPIKRKSLKLQKHHIVKKRTFVDTRMNEIVAEVSSNNESQIDEINESNYRLGKKHFPCYKSLLNLFSNRCFDVAKSPYVRSHLQKLVNMCAVPWLDESKAIASIQMICSELQFPDTQIH